MKAAPLTKNVVARACAKAGFDLCAPLRVGDYNALQAPPSQVETLGSDDHLALVIGNTKSLWPVFLGHLRRHPKELESPDPLDAFVERTLERIADGIQPACELRFGHRADPGYISMQSLAEISGLAHTSPSRLSIHPLFGPWIALRAVIILPEAGPRRTPGRVGACAHCETECLPLYRQVNSGLASATFEGVRQHWQDWLRIRDACPVGRQYRYADDQIEYHYSQDRSALRKSVANEV